MIKFADMLYKRPDIEGLKRTMTEATEKVIHAQSYAEVREAFFDVQDKYDEGETLYTIASIRNTMNTEDEYYDAEVLWLQEQMARMIPFTNAWNKALTGSAFRKEFEAEFGSQLFKIMEASLMTEDERIVPETIEDGEITQEYVKTVAQANTELNGEKCNFYGLLKHMESTDRQERKNAFEAWAALDIITPAVTKIRDRQRARLGVDKLKYYDEALKFPEGNAKPIGTMQELVDKAQIMYRAMSRETGEFFDFMKEYQLFDLETRHGKHMGGYMTRLPSYKAPFIFSNFNGTLADVDVLTHEAGHAFQGYISMRSIPITELWGSTSEINEVHSMSMEHFAYPWMESFFGPNAEKYRITHLVAATCTIPYLVSVDEFQHRVYADPKMDAMERRRVWREIEQKYMPWRDYDGNAFLEEGGFWMQKQHIFLYPFYYIEYALAQICAFQYYGRMKEDRSAAWEDYLRLCKAGGTKGYFELLGIGNLLNPFKEGTVEKATRHVINEIMKLY